MEAAARKILQWPSQGSKDKMRIERIENQRSRVEHGPERPIPKTQRFSPDMDADDVIRIAGAWKEKRHTCAPEGTQRQLRRETQAPIRLGLDSDSRSTGVEPSTYQALSLRGWRKDDKSVKQGCFTPPVVCSVNGWVRDVGTHTEKGISGTCSVLQRKGVNICSVDTHVNLEPVVDAWT